MALTIVEGIDTVTSNLWVKIADAGQRYLLQVESNGDNIMKLKSFATEQVAENIPKTGGAFISEDDVITDNDFDGFIYIIANEDENYCKYNLHREG